MDSKRDIYNLWVQYTTKNEEQFFRNFIFGFVSIWEEQLKLDEVPPHPSQIKADLGPHIKRLPEELIPAIQKFLFIAKSNILEEDLDDNSLNETALLVKCLIIICRHFDNIPLIIRSNFISCCIEMCNHLLIKSTQNGNLNCSELDLIKTCCQFLEFIYDPYFQWRNFVHKNEYFRQPSLESKSDLHAEIIPFIYTCFAESRCSIINGSGCYLLNIVGGIVIGSLRNAQKVICPATVKIIMGLLSSWNYESELRQRALRLFNVMLITLLKSNPVERQIELSVVIENYQEAIDSLLQTTEFHHKPRDQNFEISIEDEDDFRDVQALVTILENIPVLLQEDSAKSQLCRAFIESNFLATLVDVPSRIQKWDIDRPTVSVVVIKCVCKICHEVNYSVPRKLLQKLWTGIKSLGKPTSNLAEACLTMISNPNDKLGIDCFVLNEVIKWLPEVNEREQEIMSKRLITACLRNLNCIILANDGKVIESVCQCLYDYKRISMGCILDLIRLVDELGKHSIRPVELKCILGLLNSDLEFPCRFNLLEVIANISCDSLIRNTVIKDFWNIQRNEEGITVPEIEQWSSIVPSSGFVFHTWLRLEESQANNECDNRLEGENLSAKYFFRRQVFHLLTAQGTGFEVFVSQDGSVTLAATTKKDYYAITAQDAKLFDNKWHSITVAVIPSKRPFSYFNVTIYKDNQTIQTASLKISTTHEKFVYCSIGAAGRVFEGTKEQSADDSFGKEKGLFPSLFERALPSIVTQAPNYFTLPLKGFSSQDSAIKSFSNGLQDNIYGAPTCLQGQIGSTLLAESTCNLKLIFELGHHLSSVISQDAEGVAEQFPKIGFCYSPSASFDNVCLDLSPGRKYNGHIIAKSNRIISVQDALQNTGGIPMFLPLLECFNGDLNDNFLNFNTSPDSDLKEMENKKLMQNPIAYFLILMKYYLNEKRIVQDCADYVPLINVMMQNCDSNMLDVHVLMSMQILIEALVHHQPKESSPQDIHIVNHFVELFYEHLVFNFKIWTRAKFQIIIGHIQYLLSLIKSDRKNFRKKYGIQFVLDTIRMHFITPNNISEDDAKAIRLALLDIVKVYIQKDISIKEVGVILSFLSVGKHEMVLVELLNMMAHHMDKNCKDQVFLLMLEPQTAELLYCLLLDRGFGKELQNALLKFMWCLIVTKWVSARHKLPLYLYSSSAKCKSLYPGLISYLNPITLDDEIILTLLDHMLAINTPSGYSGVIYLINHLQYHSLGLKLEIGKRLMTAVFTNSNASELIAQQFGWQYAITKLFVKRSINAGQNVSTSNSTSQLDNKDFISFDNDESSLNLSKSIGDEDKISGSLADLNSLSNFFEGDSVSLQSISTLSEVSNNTLTASSATPTVTNGTEIKVPVLNELEQNEVSQEDQLVYLLTNIIFTILWRGVGLYENDSWKEEGQIVASINLLALNNELCCSHLILRLKLLEMAVQACLISMSDSTNGKQVLNQQQNASQLLKMIYDLVVLDQNADDQKKCSTKLLDGALALLDALMVFQDTAVDDWDEMKRVCLGLLIQCSHSPDPAIVAMATAKLHYILQCHHPSNLEEISYLVFKLNSALENAMTADNTEEYSFLIPVMRALLDKSEAVLGLTVNASDLPSLASGPDFFQEFQEYSSTKQWKQFISKRIKPLHDAYQKEIEKTLWEPLNIFWAECYEACKKASTTCKEIEKESRFKFQEKVILPWKQRQQEEVLRQNGLIVQQKAEEGKLDRQYRGFKRIFYAQDGPWRKRNSSRDYWKLINRDNYNRMRMKLEPNLYHNPHTIAANLRDNTTIEERRLSADFGPSINPIALQEIADDDDFVVLEEDMRFSQEPENEGDKEKIVMSQECELIVLMSRIKGKLEITPTTISFIESGLDPIEVKHDFKFNLAYLKEIHLRKYNLRRSALELFLVDHKSYFINLTTKTRNKVFSKILGLQPPNIQYGSGRSPGDLLKSSGLTQKWINREISNFEYLMHLNTIAGRTHNDLSQYPIFPWILADYTSEILDLTNPKTYRDLSKPIGVVNPKNEVEVRNKYDNFEDPSEVIPKFHYGTHYSNSAGVLHYLIRLEPFTSLHVELQSGRFDVADRQFHSIAQTWKQLIDGANDVKELIPEFFYFPDFLKNVNSLDLGINTNTKERVSDVILPPWAQSPEDFIAIHRRALESEYVSQNLHNWIDLIFGYKQKGKEAAKALNVFYYCSYEGAVDLDKIKNDMEREAVEGMINNFGQTPSQLMKDPHPKRLSQEDIFLKLLKNELKKYDMMSFLDRVNSVISELSNEKDPIVFVSQPRTPPRSFLQSGPDVFFTISRNGFVSTHNWLAFDKEKKGFLLEIDQSKMKKQIVGPFHPSLKLNSSLFAVNLDGKLLYSGGIWDCSLKVFSIQKCKSVASVIHHKDIITCLSVDNCGLYLITGSRDCTSVIWSISNTNLTQNSIGIAIPSHESVNGNGLNNIFAPQPLKVLYGHDQAINSVCILTELDAAISGSMDGKVNIYSIEEGHLIRTLSPVGCTGIAIEISFVTINYQGHIAFSALDDTSYSVHVFTINGNHLGSKYVSGRVTNLLAMSDYLVVSDDAGDVTISRLNGLRPVFDIPLHIPIETIVATQGNSHILAPMRDGCLAVIGIVMNQNPSGRQSIQTV